MRLQALLPHAGAMCLLEAVLDWDESCIRCSTQTHLSPTNPLRHAGRLGILCGLEYAGQAMALHGGLTQPPGAPQVGYLVASRGLEGRVARLDELHGPLIVRAERLGGDARTTLYAFDLQHDAAVVLQGQATIVLRDPANAS